MDPRLVLTRLRRLAGEHKLFTGALAVGALLRLVASIGYPGALWFAGDSYVYLGAALRPQPNLSKSTGYSLFLRLLLPFHSLTLVTAVQHLMGLAVAVLIYVLLRRNNVSKTWSAIATLPVLLDGYIIENEHLIMAESLFTFLLMVAVTLLLWRPRQLLVGGGDRRAPRRVQRDRPDGGRGHARRAPAVPAAARLGVEDPARLAGHDHVRGCLARSRRRRTRPGSTSGPGTTARPCPRASTCGAGSRRSPTARGSSRPATRPWSVPTTPIADRTPPGNFVWHAPQTHQNMDSLGGPVSYKGNQVLTDFAIKAVEAQPLDYLKTVFFNTAMSFGFPRIAYPGAGTTYFYSFHLHYVTAKYNLLPPDNPDHEWIRGGTAYQDWLSYGHQAPGVVHKVFAIPIAVYQRVVFTYGPLLALIFLVGLGGLLGVRRRGGWQLHGQLRLYWAPRGTTMLPWVTAAGLLLAPIAVADFDYRYLIPAIPFACLAAGLAFAPRRAVPAVPAAPESVESTVPDQVA